MVRAALTDDAALQRLEDKLLRENEPLAGATMGTTQAVDLVGGGVKANALPQSAWAIVDHRIADWR